MSTKAELARYLEIARDGYNAPLPAQSPHLRTSVHDSLWRVGQWMKITGRTEPRFAKPSRGYNVLVNDMTVRVDYTRSGVGIDRVK